MSMVPPPASMIKACSPGCGRVRNLALGGDSVTNLQVFTCLGLGSTEAETCFAFGHKVDARMPSGGVGDNARFDRGGSQLRLLWASPSVWMGQHQLNGFGDGIPSKFSVRL